MSIRSIAALALLAGITAAQGCSSSGQFDPGPRKTTAQRSEAFPVDFEAYGKVGYRQEWKAYPTLSGSLPITDVLVMPDGVAAIEAGSNLTVLEPVTGGSRCSTQLAGNLTRFKGLGRMGDRIVAISDSDALFMDPTTCNLVGRSRLPKIVTSPPAFAQGLIILGTPDGELMGINEVPNIGAVKMWGFGVPGAIERRPVVVGENVAAISQQGEIAIVNARSGQLAGRAKIFGGADTDPVTNGQLVFIASLDQSLYAFAPNGQQVWRYRTAAPLRVQPTAHGDRVYCAIPELGLSAFDAASGKLLWSVKGFSGTVIGLNKGRLFAFDGSEGVLLDPQRGDVIDRAKLPGVRSFQTDAFENGGLYAISSSGVVGKFMPR